MELYPLDILIHIVNIVVTYLLLRVLLYKPVRKFMDERAQKIEHLEEMDYEKAEDVFLEAIAIEPRKEEPYVKLAGLYLDRGEREKAKQIIADAKQKAEEEKKRAMEGMQDQLADAATQIAGRLLRREVSLEDNRRVVDEFFDEVK